MRSRLTLGSKVSFLKDTGSGIILAIQDGEYLVEDEHGFENWHDLSDLVPTMIVTDEKLFANNNSIQKNIEDIPLNTTTVVNAEKEWRIDLHLENLLDNSKGMTNHEIVTLQLLHFKGFLKKAEQARAGRLTVVHGVGKGKLKGEIQQIVRGINGAEMFDADYHQGSSIIERKYNVR